MVTVVSCPVGEKTSERGSNPVPVSVMAGWKVTASVLATYLQHNLGASPCMQGASGKKKEKRCTGVQDEAPLNFILSKCLPT